MKMKRVAYLFLSLGLVMLFPINAESSQPNQATTKHNVHAGITKTLNGIIETSNRFSDKMSNYKKGYTTTDVNIRDRASIDAEILTIAPMNSKIKYRIIDTKQNEEWVKVIYDDLEGYIYSDYISDKKIQVQTSKPQYRIDKEIHYSSRGHLTRQSGVFWYNNKQRESYYNLNMYNVVRIMRNAGFSEAEYPYWIRSDGCKMLGNYIMVAANLNIYPRGSIIQTSLGNAIVADTGTFINQYPLGVDIAVTW